MSKLYMGDTFLMPLWIDNTFLGTVDKAKKVRDVISDEIRHLEKQLADLRTKHKVLVEFIEENPEE